VLLREQVSAQSRRRRGVERAQAGDDLPLGRQLRLQLG
jgi:hypothetical protein